MFTAVYGRLYIMMQCFWDLGIYPLIVFKELWSRLRLTLAKSLELEPDSRPSVGNLNT
jgi:hypothetical protein